jgi:hypothetical protein
MTRTRKDYALVIGYTLAVMGVVSCAIVNGSAYRAKDNPPLRPCAGTHTADSIQICRDTTGGV